MKQIILYLSLLLSTFSFSQINVDVAEIIRKHDEKAAAIRNRPSSEKFTKSVFNTINHARVDPKGFIEKYKPLLEEKYPKLLFYLSLATPQDSLKWDVGAVEMARKKVEENDVDPDEIFEIKSCGYLGSGGMFSPANYDSVSYVASDYTVINDPGMKAYGLYFSKNSEKYAYYYTSSCEQKKYFLESVKVDSSQVDSKKLNTAVKEKYMSNNEKRMIYELNFVRQYPKVYAKIIQNEMAKETNGLSRATYIAAVELIDELNSDEPRQLLYPDECIRDVAKNHAIDCEKRGKWAHEGSDGKHPYDRIPENCKKVSKGNENLVSGMLSPREASIFLLLDPSISSRGHRRNSLNPEWNSVGVYYYLSEKFEHRYMYVQNFGLKD